VTKENHDGDRTRSFTTIGIGDMIGHYRILDKLGAGGMGEVYLAEDTRLDRRVALKFLPVESTDDEDCKARFLREARAAAALDHPNIIVVFEVDEFRNRPYIVMQHLQGKSLREIIKRSRLSLSEAIDTAMQVGAGLDKAHAAGIIHRDIKPSNIMIDADGQARVLDFGLAVFRGGHDLTRTGSTLGTIGYMSPEQVRGEKVDQRSDIFSTGVILYEMLTGRAPFKRDSEAATLQAILNDLPDPVTRFVPELPDRLQAIIDKCLDKDRDVRYQHMDEFIADLKRLRREMDSGISQPGSSSHIRHRAMRPSLIGLTVLAAIIMVLVAVLPGQRQLVMRWAGLAPGSMTSHLAILPFENIGTGDQAFCDGLLETLTCKVSQMEQYTGGMRVVPASDVRQVGISSARQARKAFAVTLVVTGSVVNMGDSMRILINLADTKTERLVGSREIVGSNFQHSALQDSVLVELATMLEIHLPPAARNFLMAGGPSTPEAYDYYLLGRGYLLRRESLPNIDTAVSLFHQALGKDSEYALAYAGLGEAYLIKYEALKDQAWIEHAEDNCRHALTLDDQLRDMHVLAGKIEQEFGRYEKSIMDFETALYLDSTCHEACYGLALSYSSLNMPKSAEASFRRAIEIKPDYWDCYEDFLMFYFYQGRHDDAYAELDNVANREPGGYDSWNNIGVLYFLVSRPEKAREMWGRSLEVEPNYGAYSNLGAIDYLERRYEGAAEMYRKALELDSSDYRVVGNLAAALHWMPGQRQKAIAIYEQAIEMAEARLAINPHSCDVLTDLAEYYAAIENHDETIAMAQRALSLSPDNWDVLMRVGVAYEIIGERATALELLTRSLECGGPPVYLEQLAELSDLRKDPGYRKLIESISAPDSDTSETI
jgi:serine/threonine-protein kinase